jgi:hypothetical protein
METATALLLLLLAPGFATAAPVDPVTTATMPPATDTEIRRELAKWFPLGIKGDTAKTILEDRGYKPIHCLMLNAGGRQGGHVAEPEPSTSILLWSPSSEPSRREIR